MEPGENIEDYVWRISDLDDEAVHAIVSSLTRRIVEKYGGTMEFDEGSQTFTIVVPPESQLACALEVEETVGGLA
jgi:hypothetical protein